MKEIRHKNDDETKSDSVKDFQFQRNNLLRSEAGVGDMSSKKKKRSRRLAGRSKSLIDASSSSRPFFTGDVSRNFVRHGLPYLRRVPTQDDIYKIMSETGDVRRPSTAAGGQKRLTPYDPLPAIGEKFKPVKNSDGGVPTIADSTSTTLYDDTTHKLTREGTYNVLKPKFVKGPINNDTCQSTDGIFKEKKYDKDISTESVNQLKCSSATIAFGPRLTKDEGITAEGLTAADLAVQLQGTASAVIPSNTKFQNKKSESLNLVSGVPMQKLYHRDKEQDASRRLTIAFISVSANKGSEDKREVQNGVPLD
jgi:hypothetical protein